MPIEIIIPRLGWSMDEGTFAEWLKSPGEFVNKGEMVFLLEGEKAIQEIESFDSGILHVPDDAPQPGDTVKVGQLIGFLLADGESPPASVGSSAAASADNSRRAADDSSQGPDAGVFRQKEPSGRSKSTLRRAAGPAARRLARQLGIDLDDVPTPDPTDRVVCEDVQRAADSRRHSAATSLSFKSVVASPRARRRARELDVDWRHISGTGRHGRVRERDVIARSASVSVALVGNLPSGAAGKHEPATGFRRTIAQRLQSAIQQTVPVTLTTRVDAAQLVALRRELKDHAADSIVPTYTDILVKLVAATLPECPPLNACWHNDGVYLYDDINIAIAVDTQAGLLAPVLKAADRLGLQELAEWSRSLIERARAGTLTQADLRGGTLTVTSLGMFGIDAFTPIIDLSQSAILGIGRIVQEPVVRDGEVVPGKTIALSLTFDHRVIDGAPAARWLQTLSQCIEDPLRTLGDQM